MNETLGVCTECGSGGPHLFSNRPLHKGTRETLLICPKCLLELADTTDAECAWCGRIGRVSMTRKGRAICGACTSLCQQIENQES